MQFALANHHAPESSKPLAEAVEIYRNRRKADLGKNLISQPQYDTIRKNLALLVDAFPRHSVADLTGDKLRAHFSRGGAELKTFNNRRGIVLTFLVFARHEGWLATDPLKKVPAYRISRKQRGTAPTLTAEKAAELMDYVESYRNGALVPFYALCLFAGIRPDSEVGEISKLTPEAINMETGVIHVEPHISKVNMRRNVAIHPNLAAWLRAYPLDKFPILATNIKQERTRIAKKFGLTHDVLRHTFISMHVGKYRSLGDAALQAGNSEEIIRKHYLDVKGQAEAEAFFSILPKKREEAGAITPAASAPQLPTRSGLPRRHSPPNGTDTSSRRRLKVSAGAVGVFFAPPQTGASDQRNCSGRVDLATRAWKPLPKTPPLPPQPTLASRRSPPSKDCA